MEGAGAVAQPELTAELETSSGNGRDGNYPVGALCKYLFSSTDPNGHLDLSPNKHDTVLSCNCHTTFMIRGALSDDLAAEREI
jgi:hypothetical protein